MKRIIMTLILTIAITALLGLGIYGEYALSEAMHLTWDGKTWMECTIEDIQTPMFAVLMAIEMAVVPVMSWYSAPAFVEAWDNRKRATEN